MAFTVVRNDAEVNDREFVEYVRVLSRKQFDLGRIARVPEPTTGRRWLQSWEAREGAQAFAEAVRKWTGNRLWDVAEVDVEPSMGPISPILLHLVDLGDGMAFGIDHLSYLMIQSAFPSSKVGVSSLTVRNFGPRAEFLASRGGLEAFLREILPLLTGLPARDCMRLGYLLLDKVSDRALVSVAPGDLAQG